MLSKVFKHHSTSINMYKKMEIIWVQGSVDSRFKKHSFAIFLAFCFLPLQILAQGKIIKTYYDEKETKLREEFQASLGDTGWEKDGYYKSFYPSGRIAVQGNFKENIKNDWFREYYDTLIAGKNPIKSQIFFSNGKKNGLMTAFSLKGDTLQKAVFKDDAIVGLLSIYHPNGKLHRQGNFVNGQPQGIVKEYYETGILYKEINFVDGQPQGITKVYYPSGNLHFEENYVNGLQEGEQKEFYDTPSSPIMLQFTMKNNAKEGKEVLYNARGKVLVESNYVLGRLNGTARRWSEETGELIYEASYKDGYKIGKEMEYYAANQIAKLTTYSNQERNKKVIAYDLKGEITFEATYQNGVLEGVVKESKPNENFWSESMYKSGKKEGETKTFYKASKKLRSKEMYRNNLLEGDYTEYFENGKTKTKGQYRAGKKSGNWVYYDENGKERNEKF